ncbi:hypothetical protein LWI29_011060 [Acer saccharum]|uniref:Uncharacterized protein n=1 Tax=Acer saccharum TaxID=4024 RepID=A0AA39VVE4_ACESA|nr:hypothetical protein LWI29_011060 [Acer saccharum]
MATTSKVNLTLMIDRTAKKVISAEAGKDFVDILFNLLSLPIGTVIKLLKNENSFGSIDNLYQSLETMDESDLQPNHNKDQLLNPTVTASVLCFHDAKDVSGGNGGVVKQLIKYIVTDDLCVKPVSMRSNVKDFSALEKRVVEFGTDKALELLRTSLKSKASLTSVFLMKNGVYEGEGRLRKAVEGRLEVLRRSMMMLMDTQERVRADMDRIVVNTVLNNKAGVQPLAAVEQNQVPTRVAIHREIIGPSNRKGPADQPAWSRSMSRPMANEPSRLKSQLEIPPYRAIKREADPPQKDRPQWFGTRNKTTVSRVEAKSHRRNERKQSPSAKRRAVEEVQSEMKVTEQCSGIAKDFFEVKGFCD